MTKNCLLTIGKDNIFYAMDGKNVMPSGAVAFLVGSARLRIGGLFGRNQKTSGLAA